MLKREEIARIKEMYPKGTPIRLYSMEGEQSVPPGSRGSLSKRCYGMSCITTKLEEMQLTSIA